jgi:hypothetical protein
MPTTISASSSYHALFVSYAASSVWCGVCVTHYFHYETNFCPDVDEDLFAAELPCSQSRSQGKNAPSTVSFGRVFQTAGCLMGVAGQIWAQERGRRLLMGDEAPALEWARGST